MAQETSKQGIVGGEEHAASDHKDRMPLCKKRSRSSNFRIHEADSGAAWGQRNVLHKNDTEGKKTAASKRNHFLLTLLLFLAQTVIAGAVTVTAIHNGQCPSQHRLEGFAIFCGDAADVSRAAGYHVVEDNGLDHHSLHCGAEETALDIGTLDAHLLGQPLQQGVENGQHGVIVRRLSRSKGKQHLF